MIFKPYQNDIFGPVLTSYLIVIDGAILKHLCNFNCHWWPPELIKKNTLKEPEGSVDWSVSPKNKTKMTVAFTFLVMQQLIVPKTVKQNKCQPKLLSLLADNS